MSILPLTQKALARTYAHPSYPDPWDAIEDYRRVMEYHSHHPKQKSQAVSTSLELPRERIRGWLNGKIPDCARAISLADERGWFDIQSGDDLEAAFAVVVAGVLSCGSIASDSFRTSFAPEQTESREELTDALRELGVTVTSRHDVDDSRPMEIVASEPGTVLGRALSVLGVPSGEKTEAHFPMWIRDTSENARESFVRLYVRERGTEYSNKATRGVYEERSTGYKRLLAKTIEETADARATAGKRGVVVSADAVRNLGLAN